MIMMDIASSWGHFISQPGNPNVALSRIVESSEYVDVLIHVIVSLWLCRPRLRLDSRLAALWFCKSASKEAAMACVTPRIAQFEPVNYWVTEWMTSRTARICIYNSLIIGVVLWLHSTSMPSRHPQKHMLKNVRWAATPDVKGIDFYSISSSSGSPRPPLPLAAIAFLLLRPGRPPP